LLFPPEQISEQRQSTTVRKIDAAGAKSAAEILVQGRIQGVGYRAFVQRKAGLLGLAGYVMNLRNGSVRVRVEGSRQSIEELTRDLEKGPPLARVESLSVTWRPATGRFTSFAVRYAEFDA
jgi:acylphosphatase